MFANLARRASQPHGGFDHELMTSIGQEMNPRLSSLGTFLALAGALGLGCESKQSAKDGASETSSTRIEKLSVQPLPDDFTFEGTWESRDPIPSVQKGEAQKFTLEVKGDNLLLDQRELKLTSISGEARPMLCMKLKTGNPSCESFRLVASAADEIYFTSGFYEGMARPVLMTRQKKSDTKSVADTPPIDKK